MRLSHELARREGVFAGISSGAGIAGAIEVAKTADPGATILVMLPDTGERYLSTPLFADVPVDMTEAEVEISRSTPSAQFGGPGAPQPAAPVLVTADTEAKQVLAKAIGSEPVVVFALEWCEFCWSLRNFFEAIGLAYRVVEIDAVAMQGNELGGRVRRALTAHTGVATIPQVFVGGEFVGGCTDVFDAWRAGELQKKLAAAAIALTGATRVDPYEMLPKWLARREPA